MARRRLARARSLATTDRAVDFYGEIYTALTSFIADKLNISPHGLTSEQIADMLREQSADEELISDITELLKQCDFARFAPAAISQTDIDRSLAGAERVMVRVEGVRFA